MKFALLCKNCQSWDTNIHMNCPEGKHILHCLNCGEEEIIVSVRPIKPVSKKDLQKAREIDRRIREKAAPKERVKN